MKRMNCVFEMQRFWEKTQLKKNSAFFSLNVTQNGMPFQTMRPQTLVVVGDIPDRTQEHKKRGAEDQVREDKQMIGTQLLDASSHFYKRVCLSVGL